MAFQKNSAALSSAKIVKFPCAAEASFLARQILLRSDATRSEVQLAIETLRASTDWRDLDLARHAKEQLIATDRIEARNAAHKQPEVPPSFGQPRMIAHPAFPAPQASRALRKLTLIAAAAVIAVGAVMLWTAATTSSANAQQQAAIWRSMH
ncbi:hypothetical protein [Falsigemmobacter faecalis]|uniref:Uncharacterized protein n=1 Tax=Falsigemmobacter faecalis TaxID=2488730 RepID=A0A3P3D8V3_9RHOB|nr:hypothetical protein [Falsigemmobacter faecalis]RRH70026.1 hypothetical protein EG244_17605 [Falsigemmobacter faecalis]